jgi:hypothetical protein
MHLEQHVARHRVEARRLRRLLGRVGRVERFDLRLVADVRQGKVGDVDIGGHGFSLQRVRVGKHGASLQCGMRHVVDDDFGNLNV